MTQRYIDAINQFSAIRIICTMKLGSKTYFVGGWHSPVRNLLKEQLGTPAYDQPRHGPKGDRGRGEPVDPCGHF